MTRQCVGCGYCCIKTPCDAARRLYGSIRECPQLIWDDDQNRYKCGLMMIAGSLGELYRKELFAGEGCCCGLNSWRQDVKKRTGIETSTYFNPLPKLMQQFLTCLAGEFISGDSLMLTVYKLKSMLEKDGICEDEAKTICNHIIDIFDKQRNSFTKGFMG